MGVDGTRLEPGIGGDGGGGPVLGAAAEDQEQAQRGRAEAAQKRFDTPKVMVWLCSWL